MDFEKAWMKVKAGTASQEELEFVDREIMRVQKEYQGKRGPIPQPTNDGTITPESIAEQCRKGAIRKIIFVVLAITLSLAIIVFLLVRNTYSGAEKNNKYTKEQAIELAIDAAAEATGLDKKGFNVQDVDTEMVNGQKASASYYQYDIEVVNGNVEVEVSVNAKNGKTVVLEVDTD